MEAPNFLGVGDKDKGANMSTIATNILRDFEAAVANYPTTAADTAEPRPAAHVLMRRLCEQAEGTRIGYREWVFPDGSELQT